MLMKLMVLSICFLLSFKVFSAPFDEINNKEVRESLKSMWGDQRESALEKGLIYTPRFIAYAAQEIILSKTMQRFANFGKAVLSFSKINSAKDKYHLLEKGGYQIADSPVNIFGLANDIVSDMANISKTIYHATGKMTSRIQLCTSNLMSNLGNHLTPLHFFNPAYHVGLLIDADYYETTDSSASAKELRDQMEKGGLSCSYATVLNNDPVPLAIERTMCIDKSLKMEYDFFKYNCAGYTRDVAKLSGIGYPGLLNVGVGAEFGSTSKMSNYSSSIQRAKSECDDHIDILRKIILLLEQGTVINDYHSYLENRLSSRANPGLSRDFILQLYVSAFRGQNRHNKVYVAKLFEDKLNPILNGYYNSYGNLDPQYEETLSAIYNSLDETILEQLAEESELFYKIHDDLKDYIASKESSINS